MTDVPVIETPPTATDIVHRAMRDELGILNASQLDPSADLYTDLQCDGIDRVGIAMGIGELTGVEIDDATMERARTVGDLIALVEQSCTLVAARVVAS